CRLGSGPAGATAKSQAVIDVDLSSPPQCPAGAHQGRREQARRAISVAHQDLAHGKDRDIQAVTHSDEPLPSWRQRARPVGFEITYRIKGDTLEIDTTRKVDHVRLGSIEQV